MTFPSLSPQEWSRPSLKTDGQIEGSSKQVSSSPSSYYPELKPFVLPGVAPTFHSSPNRAKPLRFSRFCGSSFPWETPVPHKSLRKYLRTLSSGSPVWCPRVPGRSQQSRGKQNVSFGTQLSDLPGRAYISSASSPRACGLCYNSPRKLIQAGNQRCPLWGKCRQGQGTALISRPRSAPLCSRVLTGFSKPLLPSPLV